jgi:long-chain acyl-CoA synthetase
MKRIEIDYDIVRTFGDIVRFHASRRAQSVALTFEGRDTTWSALESGTDRVANALHVAGCRPGDRVAFVGKGTYEFFELLFGVAKAGAVIVPVQWRLAAAEMQQILADSQARLLFVGSDQFEKLDLLRAAVPNTGVFAMEHGHAGLPRYADWRDAAPPAPLMTNVDAAAPVLQLYTSGTTGLPKGVMLSHRNILQFRRDEARTPMGWNDWLENDVNLVAMPVGHIGGVGWGIVSLLNGARTVIHREFIPAKVLDAIESQRISHLFVVPTALQMLLLQPRVRQIDYRHLRNILYGASPIALDLLREATEVFGCGFCQQYGMTETSGTVVYLPPSDHSAAGTKRMRAAGIPMPGVEIRVVHPQSRQPVAPGEVGEVETRSVANMVGYWNQPEATADAVNAEGWLRTGDAGYLDEDQYLYIHDRFKDMIVSGAENIYPAEIENAIYGHPAVQEVAVIGVPDDQWGEAVKAMVVLKPGATADIDGILAFARHRIAAFKLPKSIDVVPALPRGATGKLLRRALRDKFWAGRERKVN